MILSTYVDDIPSAFDERDRAEWEEIKKLFHERYKIKFLGEAEWLLNMRIMRDRPTSSCICNNEHMSRTCWRSLAWMSVALYRILAHRRS